ncbi:MAG: bifunctional enoyl-CoA hydratase/phosphate acetyltransferase [Rhodospirillales bacterium]|nr:bifunctional enoyl-CoA hydratase/phosphate acetyltransferase [Rhodospirillales bacterium]
MTYLENRTFDQISIGDSASLVRTLSQSDIELFAVMSGDVNPAHLDEEYARKEIFHKVIAHGMWGGALISSVLGTTLPGPGTIYIGQTLNFLRPVGLGDEITVTLTAKEKDEKKKIIVFDCSCVNQTGKPVIEGSAKVLAPTTKIKTKRPVLPEVFLHDSGSKLRSLIEKADGMAPIRTTFAHPVHDYSFLGIAEAARAGFIEPILIGPEERIRAAAEKASIDIKGFPIIPTNHSHNSAEAAVKMARAGEADSIVMSSRYLNEIMDAAQTRKSGIRTDRVMSHVSIVDMPFYQRPLLVSDAYINTDPNINEQKDIIENAVELAQAMGLETPNVALLASTHVIDTRLPSTVEAAALCKMADRGQIKGGIVEGPMTYDMAISEIAAEQKGVYSPVCGATDIAICPNLEAAHLLIRQLTSQSHTQAASIVLGGRVPIILPSRGDEATPRLASHALAVLMAAKRRGEF